MNKFLLVARRCGGLVAALVLTVGLTACGGGGGSSGTPVLGPGSGASSPAGGASSPATAGDLVVTLSTASLPSDGSKTALLTVTAVDTNRSVVEGVPVTIAVDSNAIVTPSGTSTDATGVVTAAISIGGDATKRTITATVTSGSITKTKTISVVDPSVAGNGATVALDLSSSSITPQVPATATVTVRDAAGAAVGNVVVNLSTSRGDLVTLSSSTALTSASGTASVTLTAGAAGTTGADTLNAQATVSGVQISASKGFSVVGASPTLSLSATTTTVRTSAGAVPISAKLLDAKGNPVSGALVKFSASTGNVVFSSATALTSAAGVAQTTVTPKDGSTSGADVVQATSTVAGTDLAATLGVQIIGEVPSATMSLSNSAVSATSPATAQVLVKDALGNPVKDAIVSYTAANGLVVFDGSTARTDATGLASVIASPASATSKGGDQIVATVTVNGVTVSTRQSVQVAASVSSGSPTLSETLSSTSVSSASPATVSATLLDATGVPVAGQVVTFSVTRGLAKTNVATVLTNAAGVAAVQLSPINSQAAGADNVVASVQYAGASLQASQGFQIQATAVTLTDFSAASNPLSAYAQTPLTLTLTGAGVDSPVQVTVTSACVALGKATLSPASFSTTSNTVTMQYRDNGCGAVQSADQLQAVVVGTATFKTLKLDIATPAASSLAFVQASPENIFLKGSGFTENSVVTFQVRDAAGNALPGKVVELRLLTGAGGVTMEGHGVEAVDSASPFTQTSDASGQVTARVNSGTLPTPVRIYAKLQGTTPSIGTVSSNLTVGIGLPSELNFSFSQGTINIEGYDVDGVANTYQIIASDRSGNPVPAGTAINFVTEGGQIESAKQIQLVNGIARATANFVSASPRPADGRITVTAYALGEESFIDLNGNNVYDAGEPFQDLGRVFKDRNFDGAFDSSVDEYIPTNVNDTGTCIAPTSPLLALDASIPSVPGTCDGKWSGAGQVYVRRAVETVLATSSSRALWPSSATSGLTPAGTPLMLRTTGNATPVTSFFPLADGDVICRAATSGVFSVVVADANPIRLNPMAAGTTVSVGSSVSGLTGQVLSGSPVPNTSSAMQASISYAFDATTREGVLTLSVKSPGGVVSPFNVTIRQNSSCP